MLEIITIVFKSPVSLPHPV